MVADSFLLLPSALAITAAQKSVVQVFGSAGDNRTTTANFGAYIGELLSHTMSLCCIDKQRE